MPGWLWLLIGIVTGGLGVIVWVLYVFTDGFKKTGL